MTTTTENKTPAAKRVPDFYVFENTGAPGQGGGKPAGAAFAHKKGKGFTILVGGKRYAAFPPKGKPDMQPATTSESGA